MDSGASHTVMRQDTFDKTSNASKEEINGTGVGLQAANKQPLILKGTTSSRWKWRDSDALRIR